MDTMASQITSLTIVYSTVYSDADQIKHQCSASLAFVQEIHRGPVNSPHKGPVTRIYPISFCKKSNLFMQRINPCCTTHAARSIKYHHTQPHWTSIPLRHIKLETLKVFHGLLSVSPKGDIWITAAAWINSEKPRSDRTCEVFNSFFNAREAPIRNAD